MVKELQDMVKEVNPCAKMYKHVGDMIKKQFRIYS